MVRKNKLYKHHKSKAFFYVRNFSIAFLGFVSVSSAVIIPTYISSINTTQISTKAESNETEKEENNQSDSESEEKNDLETYSR